MGDAVQGVAEPLAKGRHGQSGRFQQQTCQRTDGQCHQVPGYFRYPARPDDQHRETDRRHQRVAEPGARQRAQQQADLLDVVLWLFGQRQAEQVLDLQGGDDDADARGESEGDRVGDECDQASSAQQAQCDQDQTGEHGAQQQAAKAELLGDRQQDHHESRRRPGDIEARSPGQRDQWRGDQYGVETVLWRHANGDRQGHGQRDGDDADRQAGADIAAQRAGTVAQTQDLVPGGKQWGKFHAWDAPCRRRRHYKRGQLLFFVLKDRPAYRGGDVRPWSQAGLAR